MIKSNLIKEFNCNIEKLWKIVTDNTQYAWRTDLSKIEIVDDKHFVEYSKNNFPTHFTITSKKYLNEYKFDFENANMKGKWIGLFKKIDDDNTLLDFTEEIETNNFMMKLFAKSYLKKQQKRYFCDLENAIK